jgi:hypothetical protein
MCILNILKFGSKKVEIGKKRPFLERIGRDVYIDWVLSVIVSALVAGTLVFLGLREKSLFISNLSSETKKVSPKDTSNIDTKTLDSVLNRYNEKALRKADLIRSFSGPPDPSL